MSKFFDVIKTVFEFVKQALHDDGKPSSSRILSLILALFSCGWVTYLVAINHQLPPFDGLVLFISTPYGLNVGSKAITSFSSGQKQVS